MSVLLYHHHTSVCVAKSRLALPGCMRLKTVNDAGHSVIVEQPDRTAQLVTEFLG